MFSELGLLSNVILTYGMIVNISYIILIRIITMFLD